ncbi:hypothetical protein, partial [Parvibaculum sp.]
WPEDCTVQWGGRGVVIGKEKSYGTAFFEAFPADGGFIRGEGETITLAEADAFAKYERKMACDHRWARKGYTNGGCICRRCGAFETRMHPILKLGSWRAPLSDFELESALEGWGLTSSYPPGHPRHAEDKKYRRRLLLRLRLNGIRLPEPPDEKISMLDREHPYVKKCRDITCRFMIEKGTEMPSEPEDAGAMETFFSGMSRSSIRWALREWCDENKIEHPDFLKDQGSKAS